MGYVGNVVPIPVGGLGLLTDRPQSQKPPNALQEAENIEVYSGRIETANGSSKYTPTALTDDVTAMMDYWPSAGNQRLIAVTADGKIWRDLGDGLFNAATPIKTGLGTLNVTNCKICVGGATDATTNKKCFVYTGASKVQVIDGDAAATTNIGETAIGAVTLTTGTNKVAKNAHGLVNGDTVRFTSIVTTTSISTNSLYYVKSAATNDFEVALTAGGSTVAIDLTGTAVCTKWHAAVDWFNYYPTFGIVYGGKLWSFGNGNRPHAVYYSTSTDHEDYLGSGSGVFNVEPGVGDKLMSAAIYKQRLLFFKYPQGVYYLENSIDPTDPTKWAILPFDGSFGLASPHAVTPTLNDMIGANETGSITSLQATQAFGDIEAGDILANAEIEDHVRESINAAGIPYTAALYYPQKKQVYFLARKTASTANDRMLVIDVAKQTPRIVWDTRNAATCLALRRDSNGIQRPIYGTADGNIYLMDQTAKNVGGTAYVSAFKTADMDFSFVDPKLAAKNKIFDWVELQFEQTGSWDVNIDVYIDGVRKETIPAYQSTGASLDSFILGTSRLGGAEVGHVRKPLHGDGRTISFKIYNTVLNRYFKIEQIIVGFRLGKD